MPKPTYITQAGDMVGGIAVRQLGAESRWVEIRDLNPSEGIESGNDMFEIGTVLVMPLPAGKRERMEFYQDAMKNPKNHFALAMEMAYLRSVVDKGQA